MLRSWTLATAIAVLPGWSFAAEIEAKPLAAFLDAHCSTCHNEESKKGGLDLASLAAKLDDDAAMARWVLVYDRVFRGEMPPPKRTQPEASERAAFLRTLAKPLAARDAARQADGRTPLRRLNRVEYENTVRDLLGVETSLREFLPEDTITAGFDNVATGLRLSPVQIERYLAAADAALDDALRLTNKPAQVNRTLNKDDFLADPNIKRDLSVPSGGPRPFDPDRKHVQSYRPVTDGFVTFTGGLALAGGMGLPGVSAPAAGTYRLTLKGQSYQCEDHDVRCEVYVSNFQRGPRLIASFTFPPGKVREIEVEAKLERGERFNFHIVGIGFDKDGKRMSPTDGAETFQGAGFKFLTGRFEGPRIDAWPPPSMGKIFGDLPVKRIARVPDADRVSKAYEVVPRDPGADAQTAVAAFAARAFRRPMPADTVARYTRLATDALAAGSTFENSVRLACKAILCSPEFLFLQEPKGRLDDFAFAARLSYFLWSGPPDAELLRLAAADRLHDPRVLREQTERLLDDRRSDAFVRQFTGQWLSLRDIDATLPDARLYPEFDETLKAAMVKETESFFAELIRADSSAGNFIHSDFAMLNRRIADHYGIRGVDGDEFRKVPLKPEHRRGGLLTQAAILKVTANGTTTSPVVRGAWVMKHLLGVTPTPPPADVSGVEPDTRGATTIREQLDKHRNVASCAGCHQYIDPPGFALESFDVIGGFRDKYRSSGAGNPVDMRLPNGFKAGYRLGKPVDGSGVLPDGRSFRDLDEYKKLLLERREQVARAFLMNLVTYATAAPVSFADRDEIDAILKATERGGYPVRTLIHQVVQSQLFQNK